jgi:hypothetical protein
VHPDKGGDAAEFREVQSAFELLRTIAERGTIGSFTDAVDDSADDLDTYTNDPDWQPPSWEFYANAAEEVRVLPHPWFFSLLEVAGLFLACLRYAVASFQCGGVHLNYSLCLVSASKTNLIKATCKRTAGMLIRAMLLGFTICTLQAVPIYKVELAKSARSTCNQKGKAKVRSASTFVSW